MNSVSAVIFASSIRRFALLFLIVILTLAFVAAAKAQNDSQENDPVKLFNQGQDAQEKRDFKTAIKFYDEAIKIAPEFPEAQYQRGTAYASLGNNDEAEKSFRRAIELRENWVLPMTGLGLLLVKKNSFTEADKFLTRSLELDEKNEETYSALAGLYSRTKPSPEIMKSFLAKLQNLTSQPKTSASIWAARGTIEFALMDKESAQKSLDNALAINPNDDFALSKSAEIAIARGNFAQAVSTAQKLNKVLPDSPSAKLLLATAYARNGNADEALKILDDLDSSNPDVDLLRNSILINNTRDASELEKQLEKLPKNVDILSRLCIMQRVSNPQKALDYCRRAAEIEPNNLDHVIAYGAALVQARQLENAIALFRKVIGIAPDNYTARANLAAALFESKNFIEAKAQYKWLIEKKPELAITYYLLAIAQDQLQEYVEAKQDYQKFLTLADSNQNQLEIDKVNLRLPSLDRLIKQKGNK